MGLGINAAKSNHCNDYELSHITGYTLVPPKADSDTIQHYKEEFELWIIENGFRELLERFALFLDSIHYHALILKISYEGIEQAKCKKLQETFEKKGVGGKLKLLEKNFNMNFQYAHYLETLTIARNCLTHRLGVIGEKDCNSTDNFELKWKSFDIVAEEINGNNSINLSLPFADPIYFENESTIKVISVDRIRRYKVGTKFSASSKDLAEICLLTITASEDVSNALVSYAKSLGITDR